MQKYKIGHSSLKILYGPIFHKKEFNFKPNFPQLPNHISISKLSDTKYFQNTQLIGTIQVKVVDISISQVFLVFE